MQQGPDYTGKRPFVIGSGAELRYGAVALNTRTGVGHLTATAPRGAPSRDTR
ncbi:hypothetical protein MOV08_08625 [Streptomyces yunnanensis]|uniref:Uncharacterized protein n=1 Tax=Streptomyces yunnanensis TaxID=156453 RepID=A0ABY8A367_9ACTN|nr:hypothetical protein [Streptomyces yunnanensis]WEB39328.1 hypothetical protein MOV08_08625 [Streptomyces yunnanensis]